MDASFLLRLGQVLLLAGGLAAFLWFRWRQARRRGARRILRVLDQAVQLHHDLRSVDPSQFPWLTSDLYDSAQRDLESVGFRFLANVEDSTLSGVRPDNRTYVRLLLLADGSSRAAIYEIVLGGPQGAARQAVRTIEIITELTDGGCVTTTTTPAARLLNPPVGVCRENLPAGTPAAQLLASHRKLLEQYLDSRPGLSISPVRNYEEALQAWQRVHVRMRRKLIAQGGISRDELRRMAPPGRQFLADQVFEEMQRQKDEGAPPDGNR